MFSDFSKFPNFVIGAVGLILLLLGLIFHNVDSTKWANFIIPLTGVGGSVFATALTNLILNRRLEGLPIIAVAQALSEHTKLLRKQHQLKLQFTLEDNMIKATRCHEYTLYNPGLLPRRYLVSMYTDTTSWNHDNRGEFTLVLEPSGYKLQGEELQRHTSRENGRVYFRKEYIFQHGESRPFRFYSTEYYRKQDRHIWSVEQLSEDFKVTIENDTGVKGALRIRIRHHRAIEIDREMIHRDEPGGREEFMFSFGSEVLPYQGFEIMWDLAPTKEGLKDAT